MYAALCPHLPKLPPESRVAAPQSQCSGMSQKLTIRGTLAVEQADFPVPVEAAWAVGGTPADCVKAAVKALVPCRPDVVLTGVNQGWNAGLDIAYSGTIGAALQGVMNGIAFEIEGYIARFRRENADICIIFTGGAAKNFAKRIKNAIFADCELVFLGLNRILEFNAEC